MLPAWDLITGISVAAGMLAALHDRERTGRGAFIELALSDVALAGVSSLGWLSEAELRGADRPRQGNHLYGSFGADFAVRDGQLVMVVALTEGQWAALQKATGTAKVFEALETALDVDLRREEERYRHRETIAAIVRPWFAARDITEVERRARRSAGTLGPVPVAWPTSPPPTARALTRSSPTSSLTSPARPAQRLPPARRSAGTADTRRAGGAAGPRPRDRAGPYRGFGLTAPELARLRDEASSRPPEKKERCLDRFAQTAGLTDVQQEILATVREFVDKEIIPHAQALEHADEYPSDIVAGMREMGLFGLTIGEEYGGLGESLLTYALVVEQIARGWMSVSGIINTHFIVAHMIKQHGTAEQKAKFLPRMAVGEVRGSFSMSEPDLDRMSPPSRPGRCETATVTSSTAPRCG